MSKKGLGASGGMAMKDEYAGRSMRFGGVVLCNITISEECSLFPKWALQFCYLPWKLCRVGFL